jgi:hypothetical protein
LHRSRIGLGERPARPIDVKGEPGAFLRHSLRDGEAGPSIGRPLAARRVSRHRATRRRAGLLLSEFFAAAETDVTREVLDRGPGHRYETISTTSLTDLTMALLLAAIEGRNLDGAVERMELDGFVVEGPIHGPWLTRLPETLRDALAVADGDDLRLYAARWLGAVELSHVDARAVSALLHELAALARTARSRSDCLYLWTSL